MIFIFFMISIVGSIVFSMEKPVDSKKSITLSPTASSAYQASVAGKYVSGQKYASKKKRVIKPGQIVLLLPDGSLLKASSYKLKKSAFMGGLLELSNQNERYGFDKKLKSSQRGGSLVEAFAANLMIAIPSEQILDLRDANVLNSEGHVSFDRKTMQLLFSHEFKLSEEYEAVVAIRTASYLGVCGVKSGLQYVLKKAKSKLSSEEYEELLYRIFCCNKFFSSKNKQVELSFMHLDHFPKCVLEKMQHTFCGDKNCKKTLDCLKNDITILDLDSLRKNVPALFEGSGAEIYFQFNNINEVKIHRRWLGLCAPFENVELDLRHNFLSIQEINKIKKALAPGFFERHRPLLYQLTDKKALECLWRSNGDRLSLLNDTVGFFSCCGVLWSSENLYLRMFAGIGIGLTFFESQFLLMRRLLRRINQAPDYKEKEFRANIVLTDLPKEQGQDFRIVEKDQNFSWFF